MIRDINVHKILFESHDFYNHQNINFVFEI